MCFSLAKNTIKLGKNCQNWVKLTHLARALPYIYIFIYLLTVQEHLLFVHFVPYSFPCFFLCLWVHVIFLDIWCCSSFWALIGSHASCSCRSAAFLCPPCDEIIKLLALAQLLRTRAVAHVTCSNVAVKPGGGYVAFPLQIGGLRSLLKALEVLFQLWAMCQELPGTPNPRWYKWEAYRRYK